MILNSATIKQFYFASFAAGTPNGRRLKTNAFNSQDVRLAILGSTLTYIL
jgi:hypothetical protein